ncbi:MAG: DUF2254 domain-containing protein [Spirochaetes bacterium]|nr:DUF2254 domain-containing protein [Spirochaetota bacterium]
MNYAALLRLAYEHKTIVRMERGIGNFVVDVIIVSLTLGIPPGKELITDLHTAYSISRHRTLQQDSLSASDRSLYMALRVLSRPA